MSVSLSAIACITTRVDLDTCCNLINVAEGVMAGAKTAVAASIATAIPTAMTGAAYFIEADKTVLATARKNSFNQPSNA
ncbi:hypothetical protein D0Y65_010924 [Glycine soja]|uniref:Uncharacterized protein n=1 Tax=Glycine soja TaxID=3848 RepID=A0A445KHL1_GLYSO|nr:hypothetical protein D0Y65_010924 [Glycine soja]